MILGATGPRVDGHQIAHQRQIDHWCMHHVTSRDVVDGNGGKYCTKVVGSGSRNVLWNMLEHNNQRANVLSGCHRLTKEKREKDKG